MDEHPGQLERKHVYEVYSQIAEHFSDTRYKPWPKIAQFLRDQPAGSIVADVGCGNGKYLGVNPLIYTVGSDICPELVAIGRSRQYEVALCDCLKLPYRSNQFDAAICIAVIHHLSTEERRLQALRELTRIVCPGGRMLVYVWAMEQDRKKFTSQDVLVPWHLQPKYTRAAVPQGLPKERNRPKKWRKRRNKKSSHRETEGCSAAVRQPEEEGEGEGGGGGVSEDGLLGELAGLTLGGGEEGEGGASLRAEFSHCRGDSPPHVPDPTLEPHKVASHHGSQDKSAVDPLRAAVPVAGENVDTGKGSGDLDAADESTPPSSACPLLSQQGYQTFQRYYHVFRAGELSELMGRLRNVSVQGEYFDHENWCVLAEKVTADDS